MLQKPFERRHERFAKYLPPTIKEEPVEVKKEPEPERPYAPGDPYAPGGPLRHKLFEPRHRIMHGRPATTPPPSQ